MRGRFIQAAEVERDQLNWGSLAWFSRPATTGATALVVIEVTLSPGGGHNFHIHPDQEESIYVIDGRIEQWLEMDSRELAAGSAVFIPKNTVHGCFNTSQQEARLLAILGPCVGSEGYETVDVSAESPWSTLRS